MPVVFWEHVRRADLRSNPDALFVFGDNEQRVGLGGQAAECRGEPNALGVAVKRWPSRRPDALWSDADFERCKAIVEADLVPAFEHVRRGGWLIVPRAGIGTGRARLAECAPQIYQAVRECFKSLVREARATAPVHPEPRPARRPA